VQGLARVDPQRPTDDDHGYEYCLAPLREEHGLAAQKLTRPNLDELLVRLRDRASKRRRATSDDPGRQGR
jgi:hypothetical protein